MTTISTPAHVTYALLLIGFVATFLTAATVWVVWYALEMMFPDDVRDPGFFLTFIIVFVPFVMLIYFGLDALIDDAVATQAGLPTEFGLPPETPVVAVVYIGLTLWLWLRWRKMKSVKEGITRRGAADCDQYRQAAGANALTLLWPVAVVPVIAVSALHPSEGLLLGTRSSL